ncbi:MAG TPA: metallophosphoesterase family protein [Thermomicrobiales bacterium]|nr:metallophosphoesterase family protein [Thermomicrobiales bacterium]
MRWPSRATSIWCSRSSAASPGRTEPWPPPAGSPGWRRSRSNNAWCSPTVPGCDDGPGIHPDLDEAALAALLAGSAADLICVGHTHVPLDRVAGGARVVNLGSVGNPMTADLRAGYGLLEADGAGYRVELRRVDYDRLAAIAAVEQSRHPSAVFLSSFLRGERRSRWASAEREPAVTVPDRH